jgi:predicted XRE-type DNA-binding protein
MSERIHRSSGNVFRDLGFRPAEAASLAVRSRMMLALREHIRRKGWTQAEAARVMGVTQPRISNLVQGRIDRFSVDGLIGLLQACGLQVRFTLQRARRRVA